MRLHVEQVYFIEVANLDDRVDSLKNLSDFDCLTQFLLDLKDSPISTFYTIDSLLTVQDSLLIDSLITTSDALSAAVDSVDDRDGTIESLSEQISDLLSDLDSLQQYNLMYADSLLIEVDQDSCDILTDWELVYEVLIDERSSEEISQRQIEDLELIALKCPTHVGHVIYSARRIVSDRTYLRYDLIDDCGRVETRSRSNNERQVNRLSLVPNPTTDQVNILLPETSAGNISITNLGGVNVYHSKVEVGIQQNAIVDTSHLTSGVYVVSYMTENGKVYTSKLVIVE